MTSARKPKRYLSAEEKYDLWVRMLTGQLSVAEAAAEAGVDRSTISKLRRLARDGAIGALQAAKPGRKRSLQEPSEVAKLQAEIDRLTGVIVDQAIELAALRGKSAWG